MEIKGLKGTVKQANR